HSVFLFLSSRTPRSLHSFPTRRSSDLVAERIVPDLQHAISLTPLYWLAGPVERIMAILCHASSRALILLGVSKRRYELALWGFLLFTLLDGMAGAFPVAALLVTISRSGA